MDASPDYFKGDFKAAQETVHAFLVALDTSKVEIADYCLSRLIPERVLVNFLKLRNSITEHVFETYPRPENYDFLVALHSLVDKIGDQPLCVESERLKDSLHQYKVRAFWKKIGRTHPYIYYDVFRSKTGRLTTCRNSFPILTMAKGYRKILKPTNSHFVELDYNAAELRTLLALSGKEQPDEDLHDWNVEHVYHGLQNREEAKKRIFAWLYNPASKDRLSAQAYKREEVLQKYYVGNTVTNPYGRKMECDSYRALNYLIQSTSNDLFLRRAIAVDKFLSQMGKGAFITALIHDSVLIDIPKNALSELGEMIKLFGKTEFGIFKTNVKVGTDYGNLEEYKDGL